MQRIRGLKVLSPKWNIRTLPPPSEAHTSQHKRRVKRLKEPKTVDNHKIIVSSGHGRSAEDKNSQRL